MGCEEKCTAPEGTAQVGVHSQAGMALRRKKGSWRRRKILTKRKKLWTGKKKGRGEGRKEVVAGSQLFLFLLFC
jgi:hypothetical protein